MNLIKICWKNIVHKPLNSMLSILLFSLGTGMISLLLLVNTQLQAQFDKNLAGIDLVLGAKGSPLQMILCSMYHIDSPTGNIKLSAAAPFMRPNHPLVAQAVPLSLGDSYLGYRIVGTNSTFFNLYDAKIQAGKFFENPLEVTLGASAAAALRLKINDTFKSNHGLTNDGIDHSHEQFFTVVGILAPSGSVADQLILTDSESIWQVHEEHDEAEEEAEAHGDNHQHKEEHDEAHEHDEAVEDTRSITALLLKYKSRTNFQSLNLARNINENTDMQAATPAFELNRLYSLLGVGESALKTLALAIIVVSGLSIFIALFNSLKERRYELALMRVMGATKNKLFALILLEALLLTVIGFALGLLLSRLSMSVLSSWLQDAYRYHFNTWQLLTSELYLFGAALFVGILAGLIPAIIAYRTDIGKTLIK